MELIKVKTSKTSRFGNIVDYFTEEDKKVSISFDENGITEISKNVVIEIMKSDKSLSLVDSTIDLNIVPEENNTSLRGALSTLQGIHEKLKKDHEKLKKDHEELKEKLNKFEGKKKIKKEEPEKIKVTKYSLKKLEDAELTSLAITAKLPDKEWRELSRTKFIDYLADKLNK
jgi:hypothetical protein